jgi:hypothetical protein
VTGRRSAVRSLRTDLRAQQGVAPASSLEEGSARSLLLTAPTPADEPTVSYIHARTISGDERC